MRRRLALVFLIVTVTGGARASSPAWVEVQSPHFSVVTDAGDKQGRHVLDQLEHMRGVFQTLFPKNNVDPVSPIVVIAVRNQKGFEVLEPEAYRGKSSVALSGLFQRTPDTNYILMRLDAQGDHPWSTIYHEYTHLQLGGSLEWLPLWLNEGLAEFFQNTEIRDKDVLLGEPSADDLLYLQQHSLIPLPVLFRVDADSPYYHEEQKGSVFYAESWALTHYLETTDAREHTQRVSTYIHLVSQSQDPVSAAEEAFGDLKLLQQELDGYTRRAQYNYFRMAGAAATIDEAGFTVRPLTQPQADAVRADFLAGSGRAADARTLLEAVLREDPKNLEAHETMGYLEFRAGHLDEAKKWYEQAVALDSKSYLAQYYCALLGIMQGSTSDEVESSLKTAIELNPRFAPAYDRLAALYGRRRTNLDEAHRLNLEAVQLDPGNLNYRLNTANILMMQGRYSDATEVLRIAQQAAKTPLEAAVARRMLDRVKEFEARAEAGKQQNTDSAAVAIAVTAAPVAGTGAAGGETNAEVPKYRNEKLHGPVITAMGVIHAVRCSRPAVIELEVDAAEHKLVLFNENYDQILFSAANFPPKGKIDPCTDLEGVTASVQYFATGDKSVDGQITSIRMTP